MANISISQILNLFKIKCLSLMGASLYLILDCILESAPNVETVLLYQVRSTGFRYERETELLLCYESLSAKLIF